MSEAKTVTLSDRLKPVASPPEYATAPPRRVLQNL